MRSRPWWIFSEYPMFATSGADLVRGQLVVDLTTRSGSRIVDVPVRQVLPLDGFRAATTFRRMVVHSSPDQRTEFLAFVLDEINQRPWRARGERSISPRVDGSDPFVAIELCVCGVDFRTWAPGAAHPYLHKRRFAQFSVAS